MGIALAYPNRQVDWGNRCGHLPSTPRFFETPPEHRERPSSLTIAMSRVEQYYQQPGQWLSNIRYSRESNQRQRSEAREAVASVLQVLFHYTELSTLCVGIPNYQGQITPLTAQFIAKKANLTLKRTFRALKVLKKSLYLRTQKRYRITNTGDYRGVAALRYLTPALFTHLGVSLKLLERQRLRAKERILRKTESHVGESGNKLLFQLKQNFQHSKTIEAIRRQDEKIRGEVQRQTEYLQQQLTRLKIKAAQFIKKINPQVETKAIFDELGYPNRSN